MGSDKRTELEDHIEACYARLAVVKASGERSTIEFLIEHLEAELAALEQPSRVIAEAR